ncbi:MAG: zf-HC2 domain-containing protein [Candidatus Eisenbacteria sp.]|nr:zf-HC2 domain-containing protein [Candidatus Eisenbacteria bacterium]
MSDMGCTERQQQIQDYLTGDLSPSAQEDLTAHMKVCSSCRRDLEAYRMVLAALPSLPDPSVPVGLSEQVIAAVHALRAARRPERETARVVLVRRTVMYVLTFAFAIALGAALWGWAARISAFAVQGVSRNLFTLWDTAKDLWYLLQLLSEVAGVLQPTAQSLWMTVQRVGAPLTTHGSLILAIYGGVLLLGTFLCWRAFSHGGERRLSHVS